MLKPGDKVKIPCDAKWGPGVCAVGIIETYLVYPNGLYAIRLVGDNCTYRIENVDHIQLLEKDK